LPNYSADFKKKTWIEAGKKVKVPTLIIHGTADEDVETIYGQELAKNIKNSTLSLYKGANHKFTNKQDFDKSIEETVQFISKYL
jgi:dipeptidyl aminopeptidase/acylaminoacyl peptidase